MLDLAMYLDSKNVQWYHSLKVLQDFFMKLNVNFYFLAMADFSENECHAIIHFCLGRKFLTKATKHALRHYSEYCLI